MFELGLVEIITILELAIMLLVALGLLAMRAMRLSKKVEQLQEQAPASVTEGVDADPINMAAYLRDEVIKTKGLLDSHAEAEGEPPDWLQARQAFLELELEAQASADDPETFELKLSEGFMKLVDRYRPEPQVIKETAVEEVEAPAESKPAPEQAEQVSEDEQHEKEVHRLRDLIGHQQDSMKNLRAELEAREGDVENLEKIVKQLDTFEAQTEELVRCIEVLEQENDRLKTAREEGDTEALAANPEELTQLRDMIDNQQSTIGSLQSMIAELEPEAGKAQELEDMVSDVLKSNQELNTCILVLEEENQSLRDQLDEEAGGEGEAAAGGASEEELTEAKQKVQELESLLDFKDATVEQLEKDLEDLRAGAGAAEGGAEGGADAAKVNELEASVAELQAKLDAAEQGNVNEELEIKAQELEALVEFKDATIEELEKQYAQMEQKYLEATGGDGESAAS